MNRSNENTILNYLQSQHKSIIAPCNGTGVCGKCKVLLDLSETPNSIEQSLLTTLELGAGVRLACTRTLPKNGSINILNESNSMVVVTNYIMPSVRQSYVTLEKIETGYNIYRNQSFLKVTSSQHLYAIGIDIGTTTCAMVLFDLIVGAEVEQRSFVNPQVGFGSDVIRRIQFANNVQNIGTLQKLITTAIDQEIHSLLSVNHIDPQDLIDVVIAGNTTMNYLLLGYNPSSLAIAPYHADILQEISQPYDTIFPSKLTSQVTIFSGLDAFVGGDIVSGVYALNLLQKPRYNILVDLGTNGEIVIANKDHLFAASTAAGPAFEGINILHGIGAVSGAINTFTFPHTYTTILDKKPQGICGSGLIDIVSELLTHNVIDKSGYMKDPYSVTSTISLFPKDVREIQLAKAAIRAGIEHLMIHAKIKAEDIDKLYVSGGFGKHINYERLQHLGMFPPALQDKIEVVGNTSLAGTTKYIFSPTHDELSHKTCTVDVVNLGTSIDFQELFINYITFED